MKFKMRYYYKELLDGNLDLSKRMVPEFARTIQPDHDLNAGNKSNQERGVHILLTQEARFDWH